MNYNPYDLVQVDMYGEMINARPIVLSGIVASNDFLDPFGRLVKPEKVVLTCPSCGSYIELTLNYDDSPPYVGICGCCEERKPKYIDPFVNPVECGRISRYDLFSSCLNPSSVVDMPVDLEKRRELFGDFIEYVDVDEDLPRSDLGLEFDDEDMVD